MELEFGKAQVGKCVADVFLLQKLLQATDGVAQAHAAFFHKGVLAFGGAGVTAGTQRIVFGEGGGFDVAAAFKHTFSGVTVIIRGDIAIAAVWSLRNVQIEIKAVIFILHRMEAEFHTVGVAPVVQ